MDFRTLTLAFCWIVVLFLGGLGVIILRQLWSRDALKELITEKDGRASLSRFQFMIFTFVIAGSLLIVILGASDGPSFPAEIPPGVYALLGISAGSYAISKGIQKTNPPNPGPDKPPPPPPPPGN